MGINGALGSSLQCLLQRRGAITASCLWKSPGLQSKVRPLLWHPSGTEPYKLPEEVIFPCCDASEALECAGNQPTRARVVSPCLLINNALTDRHLYWNICVCVCVYIYIAAAVIFLLCSGSCERKKAKLQLETNVCRSPFFLLSLQERIIEPYSH